MQGLLLPIVLLWWGAEPAGVDPDQAWRMLAEGNAHYAASKMGFPHEGAARRAEVAQSQHPIAAVLSCSDSRVPPELLFDQGIGDLFVVRSAGQVADAAGLGSLEYAAEHLGVRLIVVLGHQRCGAVSAAFKGDHATGNLATLVGEILPAVGAAKHAGKLSLDDAIDANVRMTADRLRGDPELKKLIDEGKLKVVAARYSLDSGKVEPLP